MTISCSDWLLQSKNFYVTFEHRHTTALPAMKTVKGIVQIFWSGVEWGTPWSVYHLQLMAVSPPLVWRSRLEHWHSSWAMCCCGSTFMTHNFSVKWSCCCSCSIVLANATNVSLIYLSDLLLPYTICIRSLQTAAAFTVHIFNQTACYINHFFPLVLKAKKEYNYS